MDINDTLLSIPKELSRQTIKEAAKTAPALLELFESACNSDQWQAKDTKILNYLFKKIDDLDKKNQFNKKQIEKIIEVKTKIYPLIKDGELISKSNIFFEKHMNSKNVYHYLGLAKEINNEDYTTECLNYIENSTGMLIHEDDLLSLYITEPKVPFNELGNHVTNLSKAFDGKLEITITPTSLSDLEKFLTLSGPLVKSLNLKQVPNINDANLQNLIKLCPNLRILIIHSNELTHEGLKNLPDLSKLTAIDLSDCQGIEEIPNLNLKSLVFLDLSGCKSLTKIGHLNLPKLIELDFAGCEKMTDEHRFEILSLILNSNTEQGINLLEGFAFRYADKILDHILDKLKTKLQKDEVKPELFLKIANYILANKKTLTNDSLIEDAEFIRSANAIKGKKNPFDLFNELKKLSLENVVFKPPPTIIHDRNVMINMERLESLTYNSSIARTELPPLATIEAFDKLIQDLFFKFKKDSKENDIALKNLQVTEASTETGIPYLRNLLSSVSEKVSEPELKLRAVLNSILHESNKTHGNFYYTNQETALITVLSGIGSCGPKKNEGIATAYELIDSKYKFAIRLPKWVSAEEARENNSRNESIQFIKNFVLENSQEAILESVNSGGLMYLHAMRLFSLDKKFWEWDDALSEFKSSPDGMYYVLKPSAASTLSNIPKIFEIINQTVKGIMQAQFLGENELMQELTGTSDIRESVHQALYIQNLIGHLVGVTPSPTFDWHTGLLIDELVEKDRVTVLKAFFKRVTPETMAEELTHALHNSSAEIKNSLQALIEDRFFNDGRINELAALELLTTTGYLIDPPNQQTTTLQSL